MDDGESRDQRGAGAEPEPMETEPVENEQTTGSKRKSEKQRKSRYDLPWKERPCHFTWDLKGAGTIDYERVIRNIDHDLEETTNILRIESLLFRAYLEVCDNVKRWNVDKAREFLEKADKCIEHTDAQLRNGYRVVALLNRIWIENRGLNTQNVADLLSELNGLRLGAKDDLVIDAVLAAALTRLGRGVHQRALQLFEEALKSFPENVDFIYGAGLMTGRLARRWIVGSSRFQNMNHEIQRLMNREKDYCLKMMRINDEYQLARSSLGMNLSKRETEKERMEGCQHVREAYEKAPQVQNVVRNLARYYKGEGMVEEAMHILEKGIESSPHCPASHFQLALYYIQCAKRDKHNYEQKKKWNEQALEKLHKCLDLNKGHNVASLTLCEVHIALGNQNEAKKIYESSLQHSEHWTTEDKLSLCSAYANFLHRFPKMSIHISSIDTWHKVMDIAASFEYLDEASGKWQVSSEKAKWPKNLAHKKLLEYYESQNNSCLEVGILHFQNFNFKEAERLLVQHDTEANFKIPWYLAQTYLKMGLEEELQALSQNIGPDEAKETFRKAHENALRAMEVGLNQGESRKLLADIALAVAHNELQLVGLQGQHMPSTSTSLKTQSRHTKAVNQEPQQIPSTSAAIQPERTLALIPLETACIKSYREAVRCGSVVASLELLRLVSPQLKTTTSRSQFHVILAEIDLCCSQLPSVHLHRDIKPLLFKDDQLDDLSRVDCEKMQNHIVGLMQQTPFFTQAWEEYFNLERRFLEERLTNNDKELELDGREEKADDSTKLASKKTRNAGITCCLYIRHLLDHIIGEFREKELGIQDQEMKQYFPLSRASENDQNDKGRNDLREKLQGYFKIDTETHYPKLFNNLLEAQPSYDSQNDFLQSLLGVVNKCKHQTSEPDKLLEDIDDLVKFSRQCMDRVEKICNFFFDAMKEARDLQTKVEQLEDDIRRGEHEKADELLEVLSSNEDFVVRIGSTWKLLKMMALIRCSRRLSSSRDLEADELWSKLTEGACALTRKLRRCHLAVEDAVKTDPKEVQTKCRDTCREAVELLNSVLAKHKNERKTSAKLNPNSSEGAQQVTETLIAFPFLDMCPDEASRQQNEPGHWKGIVKHQLEKNLSKMGVRVDKKLVGIIWKAQPCTDEENYQFLVVEQFLKQCDEGGIILDTVSIQPINQEEKTFQVLDLTRWITDNAEKIAIKIDAVKVAGQ